MTALVDAGRVEVEVCADVGRAANAGVWDQTAWNQAAWAQTDESLGDWVDVTCDVADGLALTAGTNTLDGIVTTWEAATLTATLAGTKWDPHGGPWRGQLGPGVTFRVRWRPAGGEPGPDTPAEVIWERDYTTRPDGPDPEWTFPSPLEGSAVVADGALHLHAENPQAPTNLSIAYFVGGDSWPNDCWVTLVVDNLGPTSDQVAGPWGLGPQIAPGLGQTVSFQAPYMAAPGLEIGTTGRGAPLGFPPLDVAVYYLACSLGAPVTPPNVNPWQAVFFGQTDDTGFSYDPTAAQAQVSCTDRTAVLSAFDGVEQNPQGSGERAATRVERILNVAEWPANLRDVTPGGVTVWATTLADAAWDMLLNVAETDLALLWVDRTGRLCYRPQGLIRPPAEQTVHIQGYEGPDVDGWVCPVDLSGQQPTVTRNIVSVSRQDSDQTDADGNPVRPAVTVTLRDDESVARYLAHSYERTDLIHTDDNWSTTVALAVLLTSAWPARGPATLDLDSRADPAAAALLLTVEPSWRIIVHGWAGSDWTCMPAGWTTTIYRTRIEGSISLLDETAWAGDPWDGAVWDQATWGY